MIKCVNDLSIHAYDNYSDTFLFHVKGCKRYKFQSHIWNANDVLSKPLVQKVFPDRARFCSSIKHFQTSDVGAAAAMRLHPAPQTKLKSKGIWRMQMMRSGVETWFIKPTMSQLKYQVKLSAV